MLQEVIMFKTIEKESEGIIAEKKSKFIANMFYVQDEEEAENIIKITKKKYYDARHHCFAYRIRKNEQIISRQSDDGEPSGTRRSTDIKYIRKKRTRKCIDNCYKIFSEEFF